MSKSRSLSDVFTKVAPTLTGAGRDIFREAEDVHLKFSREARIAEVNCALPRLYPKREIYALEAKIREAYDLAQVRILTHYDPSLFNMDYMSEIFTEAGRIGIVAQGRNLPVETVRGLADGRVFSAKDALKNKLIDGIGHEADAMRQLRKLAGGDIRIYEYSEKKNIMDLFSESLILESADGLLEKMKAVLAEETAPRAEYRAR